MQGGGLFQHPHPSLPSDAPREGRENVREESSSSHTWGGKDGGPFGDAQGTPKLNRNMPKQFFFDGEHQSSIQRRFKLIDPICLSRNGYHISYLEGGRFLCARFPEKKLVLLVVGGLSFCLKNISHSPFMKKKHWCFRIKGFFLPLSFKKWVLITEILHAWCFLHQEQDE